MLFVIRFLPILGEDGSGAVPTGGGFEFGVDPNEDPELALALRVSMEEQRARQEAENAAGGGSNPNAGQAQSTEKVETPTTGGEVEDPVLARALAMSVGESSSSKPASSDVNLDAMTEDEQIAYAMRMSMQEEAGAAAAGGAEKMEVDEQGGDKADEDYSEAMNDPAFLQVKKRVFDRLAI